MILVTGATGIVGRQVLDRLLDRGAEAAAVSRSPSTAALPDGVRVVRDVGELPVVEAVLIAPRAVGPAAATARLLALAAERGARRVVVLSAATVQYGGGHRRFADEFRAVEEAAETSGLEWTFLRCADFAANALAWAPQIRATGTVRGAHGDAATSPVHERDVAAVAVRTLLDEGHAGRAHVLTGPQSLSQRDKVRLIGAALGRELSFQEISPEQVRQALLAQGLPQDVPDRLIGYLADHLDRPGPTTDAVARLLGRPARGFADWAADHAAAFHA